MMGIFLFFVSALCICFEGYLLYYLISKIIRFKKLTIKDTIVYPALIIILIITLIAANLRFSNSKILSGLGSSLKDSVSIVALNINTNLIMTLVKSHRLEAISLVVVYVFGFVISALALLSFSISMSVIMLRNSGRNLKNSLNKKRINEFDYVFGFNNDCKEYLKNYCDEFSNKKYYSHRTIFVLDSSIIDKHEQEKFFLNKYNIPFVEYPYGNEKDIMQTMNRLFKKHNNIKFITFFDDDKLSFDFVQCRLDFIEQNVNTDAELIVVANYEQEKFLSNMINSNRIDRIQKREVDEDIKIADDGSINFDVKDRSNGLIRIINKYDLISHEFVKNHNFAKYFPKELLNDDLTVRNADINLYIFGFGRTNQAILRDVLICNQFVEKYANEEGKLTLHPKRMNVKIYDSKAKLDCFELNNGLFKYDRKSYINKGANFLNNYLDLPEDYVSHVEILSNKSVYGEDVVKDLFDEIDKKCCERNQVNYFIISIGDDFANSDFAVKLRNNFNHIYNKDYKAYNTYFIKTEYDKYDVKYGINGYGSYHDVFIYNNIVGTHTLGLASDYHKNYSIYADGSCSKEIGELTPIKRLSNYYTVYSLYFKLSLLAKRNCPNGIFDYATITKDYPYDKDNKMEKKPDSNINTLKGFDFNKEQMEFYEIKPCYSKEKEEELFKLDDVFAFMEHEKWNAYELSQGVLPMGKSYVETKSKDPNYSGIYKNSVDELYHFALTSSLGIRQYYYFLSYVKNIVNAEGKKIIDDAYADVIKYDYDVMNYIIDDINSKEYKMEEVYNELIKFLTNEN